MHTLLETSTISDKYKDVNQLITEHFGVNSNIDSQNVPKIDELISCNELNFIGVTCRELKIHFSSLLVNKAPGYDRVNVCVKNLAKNFGTLMKKILIY